MSDDEPSASEAFELLRAEVALLRRAIEGLSAAAVEMAAPDYSPTLAGLRKAIDGVSERVEALASDPPVTSNQIAAGIAAVAAHARNEGQRELAQAKGTLEKGVRDLVRAAGAIHAVRADRRKFLAVGILGLASGIGIWAALAGPIARTLPETWQLPERMASATLDRSQWEAGAHLMATANPAEWEAMAEARSFVNANFKAIKACAAKAKDVGRAVRCDAPIRVQPSVLAGGR